MSAVKDGKILELNGPRSDLATFIKDIKKDEANSESCVTRSGHTTPVEQAPASREATPGQPGN
jgi:hypothetical protein